MLTVVRPSRVLHRVSLRGNVAQWPGSRTLANERSVILFSQPSWELGMIISISQAGTRICSSADMS